MHYLVNSQEMKQYDQNTISHFGIPSAVLMERAALALFDEITKRFMKTNTTVLILCGAGNNGGDGFACARLLHLAGYQAEILFPMDEKKMTEETSMQYAIAKKYQIPIHQNLPDASYDVIVDALFGIGLSREIEGTLHDLITKINERDSFKVAADICSGVSSDTGEILKTAFLADLTVTFAFAKIGHFLYPGARYAGELVVREIGILPSSFLGRPPKGFYWKEDVAGQRLPGRIPRSNKGSYGRALVIAGSKDMAGAAYFAAKAAYYSGCGLVRIFTAEENRQALFSKLPEAIITSYDAGAKDAVSLMASLDECIEWADAVLIGPGIGTSPTAQMMTAKALHHTDKGIIFDADALNILSKNMVLLKETAGMRIMTPHLKEMSRLIGKGVAEIQSALMPKAVEFAKEYQAVCVLKDARTVIGMPEGDFFLNTTGNNGMASGGSGDVLAGFMAGFLAQGMDRRNAAALSVYLHGLAGDFAAKEKGQHSMLASDILEHLPAAIQACSKAARTKNENLSQNLR